MSRKKPALHVVPTSTPEAPSLEQARQHLELLKHPTIALRILGGVQPSGRPLWPSEGYWDSPEGAAQAALDISQAGANAVYVALNPIDGECLHRSVNAWGGKGTAAVSNEDVTGFRHLLIDLDPVRPKGVSSTQEELGHALERAKQFPRRDIREL